MAEQNHQMNNDLIQYTEIQNKNIWSKGRLLGRGTYGDVLLYTLVQSGYNIAVKEVRMDPSDGEVPTKVKALRNEINRYTKLPHERIVKYLGSNEDMNNYIFLICLEYMPGGSLYTCLHKDGKDNPFEENRVRKYTKQLLEGIKYLHENNIVHLDIKELTYY